MSTKDPAITDFSGFALTEPVLRAVADAGYTEPTPIQSLAIPPLLEGRDVVGQAQTGTGKTAAFALPLLSQININKRRPQVLVLMPTRELAIQVSAAFQTYAKYLPGLEILSVYGGQHYKPQLDRLDRGVHIVVGTPGRVMDHMRRGSLVLDKLKTLVLDEADEMLRMGFIDDVEWVLENSPDGRRIALFSATMPAPIRAIAARYLNDPHTISIESRARAAETVRQRALEVESRGRFKALIQVLLAESYDGVIVFVRTRGQTGEIAEKLQAQGLNAACLNGDMPQRQREQTIERLRSGRLDILVATDVAARGLDVRRVTHVINYEIPREVDAYVHRIGRTGRAGSAGDAILFVTKRDRRMLSTIERTTRQPIERMTLPTLEQINTQRVARYKERITAALSQDLSFHRKLLEEYCEQTGAIGADVAAALSFMAQGNEPLLIAELKQPERQSSQDRPSPDEMETFRLEIGRQDGIAAGNIVGVIANVGGIDGQFIGRIEIRDDHSLVGLPEGMPDDIFEKLSAARVYGKELRISRVTGQPIRRGPPQRSRKKTDGRRAGGGDSPRRTRRPTDSRRVGASESPRRKSVASTKRPAGGKKRPGKHEPGAEAQGGMGLPTRRSGKAGAKYAKRGKPGKKKSSRRS